MDMQFISGDALTDPHNGKKFSTQDRDNDLLLSRNMATEEFAYGAWWYNSYWYNSNLNGKYGSTIKWGWYSGRILKSTKMMIKRRH